MAELTDNQRLEIDVKLPPEVWAHEPMDELLAALFRLTYATGYHDGQDDLRRARPSQRRSRAQR